MNGLTGSQVADIPFVVRYRTMSLLQVPSKIHHLVSCLQHLASCTMLFLLAAYCLLLTAYFLLYPASCILYPVSRAFSAYCLLLAEGREMGSNMGALCRRGAVVLLVIGFIGCAAIPRLSVTYKLPPTSGTARSTPIYLTIKDDRPYEETMGIGARKDFGGTPISISLAVKTDEGESQGMGVFELPMLLKEGFSRRIERAGLDISQERRSGQPEIAIVLKEFLLDLVDRKWRFVMGYEARLIKEGKVLASQNISGNGERLKLIGHKQADEVVTEVFTDTLNQFNPNRLFQQAGL